MEPSATNTKVVMFLPELMPALDGDAIAALIFSQIAYWYRRTEKGKSKLRVFKKGNYWLAKSAPHWHEETGVSEKQARRAIAVLKKKEFIATSVMRFDGSPTTHIRLTDLGYCQLIPLVSNLVLPTKSDGPDLKGKSLTGNTAETTAETTTSAAHASKLAEKSFKENQDGGLHPKFQPKAVHTPEEIAAMMEKFST